MNKVAIRTKEFDTTMGCGLSPAFRGGGDVIVSRVTEFRQVNTILCTPLGWKELVSPKVRRKSIIQHDAKTPEGQHFTNARLKIRISMAPGEGKGEGKGEGRG